MHGLARNWWGSFAVVLVLIVLASAAAEAPNEPKHDLWPTAQDQKYYEHEFEFQHGPEQECRDGWGVDPATGCSRAVGRT